jgi:D-alanine-D-alanine ligase
MSKKNVAVVMGGFSDEYKVSEKWTIIYDSLDRDLYNVYKVVILKEGWYFLDENEEKMNSIKEIFL